MCNGKQFCFLKRPSSSKVERGHVPGHQDGAGFSPFFGGGGPSSLFYFGCGVNHSWRRRMEKNTLFILTQDASQGGHFFLLNCGDSFSPPRTLKCTRLVKILIIPPSHYPIAETFLFLFFFFFFSVHPFRAVDTDSWQMSEIIIVVIFFFSGYLSFAWQNVKSTEFQFCIVLQWG